MGDQGRHLLISVFPHTGACPAVDAISTYDQVPIIARTVARQHAYAGHFRRSQFRVIDLNDFLVQMYFASIPQAVICDG